MRKAPILYFTRMFPPAYRIPILQRLNSRLGDRLVVCAGRPPRHSSLRSLAAEPPHGLRHVRLRNVWIAGEGLHVQLFGPAFRLHPEPGAVLVEENPRSLSLPLLLGYVRRRRVGSVLWGHYSSNRRDFSPRHLPDRYRLWLARRADACLCYTEEVAGLLRPHLPAERLFVARNTLDTDTLFALRERLDREGRAAVRHRLGLPVQLPVLVFVGRLVPEKGIRELFELFRALRRERDARLLIVGDGPERPWLETRLAQGGPDGVHLLGSLTRLEDSAPYLYCADALVVPGYLGLVVNHAFALGVPVVSQQAPPGRRFHSPEAAYVRPGENGMLAEFGSVEAMLRAVRGVLDRQPFFSQNALRYAKEHLTVDHMVDGMVEAVRFAERASTA